MAHMALADNLSEFLGIQLVVEIHFVPLHTDQSRSTQSCQMVGNSTVADTKHVCYLKYTQSPIIVLFQQLNNPLPCRMSQNRELLRLDFCLGFR